MADQRPPRFAGDERETLLALWRYHQESFIRKVTGVSGEDAQRRFVDSDTTLLWLTTHLAHAHLLWVAHRFAGGPEPAPATDVTTIGMAIASCERAFAEADAIVAGHDFDELCALSVHGDDTPVNLRWVVAHLLEETARHAGHADIIRELIDGSTGR